MVWLCWHHLEVGTIPITNHNHERQCRDIEHCYYNE